MKLLAVKLEVGGRSVEITRWADLLMVISSGKTVGLAYEGPTRTALKIFKALDYTARAFDLDVMESLVEDVWEDWDIDSD